MPEAGAEPAGVVALTEPDGLGVGAEVVVEAEVLGEVVIVLPAVVEGPVVVVDAVVPGAVAEVLLEVEAVPVCAEVPEAVVVLPGLVVLVEPVALGAVDAVFAPLMSAVLEVELLGVVLEADDVGLLVLEVLLAAQLPIARTL